MSTPQGLFVQNAAWLGMTCGPFALVSLVLAFAQEGNPNCWSLGPAMTSPALFFFCHVVGVDVFLFFGGGGGDLDQAVGLTTRTL